MQTFTIRLNSSRSHRSSSEAWCFCLTDLIAVTSNAKTILDAGLLVEHMVAEIPLEQNLADNSELKQLADNAKATFGLIVCFGCNRAFDSKDEELKNCPNCGAKLSEPEVTPMEPKKS